MPEANVLYAVTAVVVAGLVAWVGFALTKAKEPWARPKVEVPKAREGARGAEPPLEDDGEGDEAGEPEEATAKVDAADEKKADEKKADADEKKADADEKKADADEKKADADEKKDA